MYFEIFLQRYFGPKLDIESFFYAPLQDIKCCWVKKYSHLCKNVAYFKKIMFNEKKKSYSTYISFWPKVKIFVSFPFK